VTANKGAPLPLPARLAAFVLVGGSCLAVNTLALWLLTSGLGIHYLVSTVIAFVSITPLGFLFNKVLTFRTRREYARIELARYFGAMAASFAMNLLLMYVLVSMLGMWYLPASVVVAVVLVIVNFLSSDRWSFRVQR
jgi:putative flippase GtrA